MRQNRVLSTEEPQPASLEVGDIYYVRLPGWKTLFCMMIQHLSERTVSLVHVVWDEELGQFRYRESRWDDSERYMTKEVEFAERVKNAR